MLSLIHFNECYVEQNIKGRAARNLNGHAYYPLILVHLRLKTPITSVHNVYAFYAYIFCLTKNRVCKKIGKSNIKL